VRLPIKDIIHTTAVHGTTYQIGYFNIRKDNSWSVGEKYRTLVYIGDTFAYIYKYTY